MKRALIISISIFMLFPTIGFTRDLGNLYASRQQFRAEVQRYDSVADLIYATNTELWITFQNKWTSIWKKNAISEAAYDIYLENFAKGVCKKYIDHFNLPQAKITIWKTKVGVGQYVEAYCP